jgi:Uma2 family endonuclease
LLEKGTFSFCLDKFEAMAMPVCGFGWYYQQQKTRYQIEQLMIAPDTTDDSRFERINGQWIERPVPTTRHSLIQGRIFLLLTKAIEGSNAVVGPKWSIDQPEHAHRDDPNYMIADVLVAYPPLTNAKNGHLVQPGFLAVEVFSPKQTDLFEKAERERLHAGDLTLSVASIFEGLEKD